MDQPPTIHERLAVSPRSVPTGTKIPVMRTKPQAIGQTYEKDRRTKRTDVRKGQTYEKDRD
jgi:hypothetical protein